ncbi:hypothetical protein ROS1_28450 [Roseibium sp. ROS1]
MQAVKSVDLTQSICAIKRQCKAKLQPLWEAYRQEQGPGAADCTPEIVETFKQALEEIGRAWEAGWQADRVIECVGEFSEKPFAGNEGGIPGVLIVADIDRVEQLFMAHESWAAFSPRVAGDFDKMVASHDDLTRCARAPAIKPYCVVLVDAPQKTIDAAARLFGHQCPLIVTAG